ncbi:Uncharacterised protein [Vibrio cholerae]|nr:Uncharacterised protein [Vibrio cholerae]
MHCGLQLLVHVVTHGVTADTELFRVGRFQSGVKAAPENYPSDKATESQYP